MNKEQEIKELMELKAYYENQIDLIKKKLYELVK
jgi:hypothetical protein